LKTNQQHIVFLTPGFPESETDSTTIPALQVFLKSLRKALPNSTLTVIAFQFPFTTKTYIWNSIDVIPLNGQNKALKKLFVWRKAIKSLKKLNKKQAIDVIHSFWIGECTSIGNYFSKKNTIKHVATVMGQDARFRNHHTKRLLNSNVKLVSLSKNHYDILLKKNQLKSKIIPWHLDKTSFPELEKSTIDILGVGSLNKVKNYSLFITTIAALVKTYCNLKVELIGEGDKRTDIEHLINSLELRNNIKLIGKLQRKDVLKKMAQSHILLHTSNFESFGFVFLEALYSGMQIVSKNNGIASPSEKWKIAENSEDFINLCENLLSYNSKKTKYRTKISSEQETINAYLELYNA
tara:strand:+ start:84 stop:1136 length:1053 start_codon:yes stop_codon:yes gene_type:complete